MRCCTVQVLGNEAAGSGYRLLEMQAPALASEVQPGQFVHVKVPGRPDLTLRRPFSVFKAEKGVLSILYKTVGEGTQVMAAWTPGMEVDLIGPLGRGFPPAGNEHAFPVLVAGGYGMAPLYLTAQRAVRTGWVFIGAHHGGDLLCVDEFKTLGWETHVATEDGSAGHKGLVTEAVKERLTAIPSGWRPEFFACGPNGMLRAVGRLAREGGWTAWLSMDRHMGCGVGACLTCVQRVRRADGTTAWARVCKEGPVFECRELVWEAGEQGGAV